MQTDKSIPYPRPDYTDGDLISKEMVNGTFANAIIDDVKHFRPVFDRYNVTQDKLTDRSILKGNMTPAAYDITITDVSLDRIKELGWQPAKRPVNDPDPEVVYDPLKYYSFVEWSGISNTDLQADIPSSNTVLYNIDTPYYDEDNPGLLGFKTIKDSNGNTTDVYAAFYSLKELILSNLGRLPNGFDISGSTYIGYVNGAFILNFTGGSYVSFTLNGEVSIVNDLSDYFTPLGDDGVFAVESSLGLKTYIMDAKFTKLQELDGRYCVRGGGFTTSPTKYPFGTKIASTYFFLRDDTSSYKFRRKRTGWHVEVKDTAAWKYTKRLKYDYATDNWLQKPLKTLKYNLIRKGLFVKNGMPPHDKNDVIEFINSDMHGDFARVVKLNGSKVYYHTYDFKRWEVVTGDAATHLYGCMGRIWTKGRNDGVSGLMPYTIAVKSINDLLGSKKTVFQFSGFIFRGAQ